MSDKWLSLGILPRISFPFPSSWGDTNAIQCKSNSFLLSLQVYPEIKDSNQACLPPSSFITCSSDNTIRLWNTESSGVHGSALHRNILSNVSPVLHLVPCTYRRWPCVREPARPILVTWLLLDGLYEPRADFTQHASVLAAILLGLPEPEKSLSLFSPFPPGSH